MANLLRSQLTIRASNVARVHTSLAFLAFGTALVLGCFIHYKKIVKNGVAGYPEEWFPSVSSTIGDWYPERNIFQILIALNSGPRLTLVGFQYLLQRTTASSLPLVIFISGIIRTLSCGGWVFITSTDDHDAHDVLMITYMLCNIPWMFGGIAFTPKECARQRRRRIVFASVFFLSIVPLLYFFIQHKVHRIPGAYTHYAFFEWGLVITDILYDSVTELTFAEAQLEITLTAGFGASANNQNKDASNVAHPTQQLDNVKNGRQFVEDEKTAGTKGPNVSQATPQQTKFKSTRLLTNVIRDHKATVSFMSDLYLAYVFWTIYTSLIPTLFYFSIWKLGIAGTELALLSILSPGLLGLTSFRSWASTKTGRLTLHVLSLSGLIAFKFPTPAQRLLFVTFASFVSCIGAVVDWSSTSMTQSQPFFMGLGFILSSLSKHANHSNNPLWPMLDERSGGYNKTGLFLAILAICELALRDSDDTSTTPERKSDVPRTTAPKATVSPWLPNALALGSLLFSLHCLLGDPSTLIAWTWTGYPIQGPVSHLHGALTLVAQSAGLVLPMLGPSVFNFLISPLWFLFGAASSFILYKYNDWIGYFGGLGLAIFLMSIIPQTLQKAAASPRLGRTYFTAFFVAVILYLANVWTVAYAFVPGGVLLRERSDLVLLAQIILLVPAFTWPGDQNVASMSLEVSPRLKRCYLSSLALMSIASEIVTVYRTPVTSPQPHQPGPRIVRAGIWTVHFGLDNEGRDSQRLMKELLGDLELDVVGLLETDLHRPVYGNRDLTRVMAEELGFNVDLGPGPNQHTWGAILLSKFPIINSTHHLLPSPHGELAPAITAYLDVYGTEIFVVVAHNGQEEDLLDRELQATELARIMKSAYPTPAIFLGYVVSKPHAPRPSPYKILVEDGLVHDIDSDDLDRWCEYILYRGLYRTAYLRMSRGKVTDTELQAGQFVVPRYGHTVVDDSESARYLRIYKESLDTAHWFPMQYYGNERSGGKNGHFYHVFGTPLYYNLPERALL